MAVTMKNIAKTAGFFVQIVSRAFNNRHDIRNETKERIHKFAAELNYFGNIERFNSLKSFYVLHNAILTLL